ncbi:MAG TPA: flagellar hook-associated protein FlgK [Clostridiales bacterium UBA8960]|nr:flagellar hook-associated protein FlgK [Clostridiales bacterium UBA8960]
MSAGFLGLTTSLSGLFANQRSLGIVSHNIANANTEGYSRQLMNTRAYQPQVLPGGLGTLGVGVDVTAVKQIRDHYLDYKMRVETSVKGEWDARASVLTELEGIFNEPSDSSIAQLLDKYYESLQSLQKNPENLTARTLVRQNTIALSEGVRRISTMLKNLQADLNYQFQSAVGEVNSYALQIAKMNESIYKAELEGATANDLRDQRNVLVDKLSELVNVEYYEDEQNRFFVLVGRQQLVAHFRTDKLELVPREKKLNDDDDDQIMDVQWATGNKLNVSSGKLKGLREVRDNLDGDKKGIPYYVNKLNEFIDTFTSTFNSIHENGYGLDGSTGNYMFTIRNMSTAEYKTYLLTKGLNGLPATEATSAIMDGVLPTMSESEKQAQINSNIKKILTNNPSYNNKAVRMIDGKYYVVDRMKASEVTVARDLEDLNKIGAATRLEDIPGDGTAILRLIETRHNVRLYEWGAPEDFIKSLVSNLGVDAAESNRNAMNSKLLVNEYSTARDSIMGVSLDEEMANMIKFQTAYNANARMVNVFDEMLDLIVNRLGTAGR